MQENVLTMSEIKSVADKSISGVSIPRMQYLKNILQMWLANTKILERI